MTPPTEPETPAVVDGVPGPLWPDDVVAGARAATRDRLSGVLIEGKDKTERPALSPSLLMVVVPVAVRAALNAPEVTAHLLAQHKDGYDSGVEAMRALSLASDEQVAQYEARLRGDESEIAVIRDMNYFLFRDRHRLAADMAEVSQEAEDALVDRNAWRREMSDALGLTTQELHGGGATRYADRALCVEEIARLCRWRDEVRANRAELDRLAAALADATGKIAATAALVAAGNALYDAQSAYTLGCLRGNGDGWREAAHEAWEAWEEAVLTAECGPPDPGDVRAALAGDSGRAAADELTREGQKLGPPDAPLQPPVSAGTESSPEAQSGEPGEVTGP